MRFIYVCFIMYLCFCASTVSFTKKRIKRQIFDCYHLGIELRRALRNLHVDPLSLHTSMRNKQVEFNPYIYTLTTLSILYRFGYEISVFNTKHPIIILQASLFDVTPSHVASSKNGCQNFSYVYRSRKH